jgi:hypothetical protein
MPIIWCRHNDLYVFGGFDGNDFYRINVITEKISRINQYGTIPCPRYVFNWLINKININYKKIFWWFQSSLIYNNKLILFGGYNGYLRLNNLYEFDLDKKLWAKLDVHDPPQERSSMVLQVYSDTLFNFSIISFPNIEKYI